MSGNGQHIQTPEDMPHILGITLPMLPQQQIEFPTRAAAIAVAREAKEAGFLEYADSSGLWLLMETKGAVFIIISKVVMQQRLAQQQLSGGQRIVSPAGGLPFGQGGY